MKLYKPEGAQSWHVQFKTETGEQTVDTAADTRAKAEEICRPAKIEELERRSLAGRLSAEVISRINAGQRVSLSEALNQFARVIQQEQSRTTVPSTMAILRAFMAHHQLEQAAPALVRAHPIEAWINRPHLKLTTRRLQRSVISSFLSFCAANGWLIGNPAAKAVIHYADIPLAKKERKAKDYDLLPLYWKEQQFAHLGVRFSR